MTVGLIVLAIVVVAVIVWFFMTQYVTDAKIRREGSQAIGKVVDTETVRSVDMYGVAHYTHYLTYEFTDISGRKWTKRKTVGDFGGKVRGDDITVYYLPDRPDKSTMQ